jgi:hypothetical protein
MAIKYTYGRAQVAAMIEGPHRVAVAYLTINLLAPEGSKVPEAFPRSVLTFVAKDPV